MDLREKETATAVQDLEIRQMELEAQRKRLEQVISFLNPFTAHILFIIHKTFFFFSLKFYFKMFFCLFQLLLKEQQRVGRKAEEEVRIKMREAEENLTEMLHGAETNMQVIVCH